ncbi:MAG: rRNA maturation RNase YbeY [Alphaproteobacteria bacterium 41-28]|nr:MAG: rRNA maturation RNase YbeY [Alphaproteobacteria bacterium 41-28]
MSTKKPIVNFILHHKIWTKRVPSLREEISSALEKTAEILDRDFSETEVSVVLADDTEVQDLNKTFRNRDKPTNVLSFPSEQKDELGDIILAYETVTREAEENGVSPLDHTLHLIIHGFLHLLGYDHEHENEAKEMENMEIRILKDLHINNPYEDK